MYIYISTITVTLIISTILKYLNSWFIVNNVIKGAHMQVLTCSRWRDGRLLPGPMQCCLFGLPLTVSGGSNWMSSPPPWSASGGYLGPLGTHCQWSADSGWFNGNGGEYVSWVQAPVLALLPVLRQSSHCIIINIYIIYIYYIYLAIHQTALAIKLYIIIAQGVDCSAANLSVANITGCYAVWFVF